MAPSRPRRLLIFLLIPWHEVPPPFEAIRTDRYLYVEYRNGWRELYDLRTDPSELSNLAGHASRRHLAAALARRLHALLS